MKNFFSNIFSSCLGTLLAMVAMVLIISALGAAFMSTGKKASPIAEGSVLKINLSTSIPEQSNNVPWTEFSIQNETVLGLRDMIKTIDKAASDIKIKGIYISMNSSENGYATLKEIRDALIRFKASGKFIFSYNLAFDHKSYYLASVADQIHLHPIGFVDLKGLSYAIPHFKELSDHLGIKYNIYYAGDFKSATEPFRFNKMSDSNRVQLRAFQSDIFTQYIEDVAHSRDLKYDQLKNIFDNFLSYSPDLALENRLVDQLSNEADVLDAMRKKLDLAENKKINFTDLNNYYTLTKDQDEDYSSSNRIALLYAEGNIIDEPGQEGEIGRKYLNVLRDIRTTNSIKALVLRINSGGGSAIMSDDFLKELKLIRSAGKPVVVSMGNYAASGGYYIACAADSVICNPYTLTGSIGVFALIPNFSQLSGDKLGVDFDTVGTGPYANKFNPMFPWGDAEQKVFTNSIERVYDGFLKIVSDGRGMSLEEVKAIAKGRIWSGSRSVALKLTHRTGSMNDAILVASKLASLDKYRVSEFPTQLDPFQKLLNDLQGSQEGGVKFAIDKEISKSLGPLYRPFNDFKEIQNYAGKAQMRIPYYLP